MNPRELRIGNYVQNSTTDELIMVSAYTLSMIEWHSCKMNPIELTEEWLNKLGFKKSHTSWQFGNVMFELQFQTWSFFGILIDKQPKYVHEIQNLIYALTGEEL